MLVNVLIAMAELCLNAPVFIASSSDLLPERDLAELILAKFASRAAQCRLLLPTFRWENKHYAASGPPQHGLNLKLERAELVIMLFWSRMGEGTLEEMDRALAQAHRGVTDNVAIYFKTQQPSPSAEGFAAVEALRQRLNAEKRALTWQFETIDDFKRLLKQHLINWFYRWQGVADACQFALENSTPIRATYNDGENRVREAEFRFAFTDFPDLVQLLGRLAIERYQRDGMEALDQPLPRDRMDHCDARWPQLVAPETEQLLAVTHRAAASGIPYWSPCPLRARENGEICFADPEWFCFFCGIGLCHAILESRVEVVCQRPYPNAVHQYVRGCANRLNLNLSKPLIDWLTGADGRTRALPVARNFAAYELGMLEAFDAQEALGDALEHDSGKDVGTYCITSLGKLRSRLFLPRLVQRFQMEQTSGRRLLLAQAISRIVGVAQYDL